MTDSPPQASPHAGRWIRAALVLFPAGTVLLGIASFGIWQWKKDREADRSFNVTKARAILRAYQSVRPLGAAELAALPVLCRGAAIRFLLTRLYDWVNTPPGAMVTRKDPLEYLHKLRFFGHASGPEAFGV